MCNVLFIYPIVRPNEKVYTGYYHGIGYLSSVLKRGGHRVSLTIIDSPDEVKIMRAIKDCSPQLICISATTLQFRLAQDLLPFIDAVSEAPVLIGGIHAAAVPDEVISLDGVDGVCYGEGEEPLLAIADAIDAGKDFYNVPNFYFKLPDKTIRRNELGGCVDLNALPDPDRELFDFKSIIANYQKIIGAEFMARRGCPYHCSYCFNNAWLSRYGNKFIRKRSVDNLLAEIKSVTAAYPEIKLIAFHDDYFTDDKEWLSEFCERYKKEIKMPFWINTRVDAVDAKSVKQLRSAGCYRVHLGLESGSETLRKNVLRKNISKEQITDAFLMFKKQHIKTAAFNMIGIPYETEESLNETIALNRIIQPDWIILSIFYPFPGTELRELCLREGWISDRQVDYFYSNMSVLDQPSISRETLKFYYDNFIKLVYG